jgi:hypothetical protein
MRAIGDVVPALAPAVQRRALIEAQPPAPAAPTAEPREVDGGIVSVPVRVPPTPVPAAWKRDVEEPIARLRRILAARAHPRTIEAWLRRVAAGVAKAPEGEERRDAVLAITLAVQSCPHLCFTAASLEVALQRWKWWPAAAEVFALCEEVARPYREHLRGLEAIAAAPVATGPGRERPAEPEPAAMRTPEEVEAVRAQAAAFEAEMRSRMVAGRGDRPSGIQARYLRQGELIAQLEREIEMAGGPGARPHLDFRLAVERRKLAAAEAVS